MFLVIAIFVIVGVYVGYHASQDAEEKTKEHNVTVELEILQSTGLAQIYQDWRDTPLSKQDLY